jgi:hypothetical protein
MPGIMGGPVMGGDCSVNNRFMQLLGYSRVEHTGLAACQCRWVAQGLIICQPVPAHALLPNPAHPPDIPIDPAPGIPGMAGPAPAAGGSAGGGPCPAAPDPIGVGEREGGRKRAAFSRLGCTGRGGICCMIPAQVPAQEAVAGE